MKSEEAWKRTAEGATKTLGRTKINPNGDKSQPKRRPKINRKRKKQLDGPSESDAASR